MSGTLRGSTLAASMAAALLVAGPAHGKYEVVAVSGGGTISGSVVWAGGSARPLAMPVKRDAKYCDPSGRGSKPTPRLQVGPGGGVANAVVFLEGVDRGKAFPAAMTAASLAQKGCEFVPHVVVARKGARLTISSGDEILHNAHMHGAASYNLPFPDKNTTTKRLRRVGVIDTVCDAGHAWMSSVIHVVAHPYYAVTDTQGRFSIGDVPPGKYRLSMWHESWTVTNTASKDGIVSRYDFGPPVVQSRQVEVKGGAGSSVRFELK